MDWGGGSAILSLLISKMAVLDVPFFFLEAAGFGKDGDSFLKCLHFWPPLPFFGRA